MARAAGALAAVVSAGPGPRGRAGVASRSASTVERWLEQAGATATASICAPLVGVERSGQLATDGLWARLGGGTKRVVLALVDNVTGVVWPPVVVAGEGTAAAWEALVPRAAQAGLVLSELRGIASAGATGLESYRRQALPWVSHPRCVFPLWRGLSGALTAAVTTAVAATELTGAAARRVARQTRRTLSDLRRGVYAAPTDVETQAALARLAAHALGQALTDLVALHLEAARYYRCGYNQGLGRASPEWLWRDFRLRSSHGRNHGPEQRLARAALLGAIYHTFEPAQERSERKRKYRHPGQAPLALAGLPPGDSSYLSTPWRSDSRGRLPRCPARQIPRDLSPCPASSPTQLRQHRLLSYQQQMEPSPPAASGDRGDPSASRRGAVRSGAAPDAGDDGAATPQRGTSTDVGGAPARPDHHVGSADPPLVRRRDRPGRGGSRHCPLVPPWPATRQPALGAPARSARPIRPASAPLHRSVRRPVPAHRLVRRALPG
jgi:hypothetical protein